MRQYQSAVMEVPTGADVPATIEVAARLKSTRLVSLDAFRGLIMITLMCGGFELADVAKRPEFAHSVVWQRLGFHTDHPKYHSQVPLTFGSITLPVGVSYWDLIQPSFMFMVGVSMPFSYAKRRQNGLGGLRTWMHVIIRSVVLVLLGVFLTTIHSDRVNWVFTNVLSQIGLGYTFAFLFLGRPRWLQLTGCAAILIGYWLAFVLHHGPSAGLFAHWALDPKNAGRLNTGSAFDAWFLNLLPFSKPRDGGYVTLNFVPSIVTMVFGLMSGELIRSDRRAGAKVGVLFTAGLVCLTLGTVAGMYVCPVVKKLWTPSWVLYSGGYVIWILTVLYAVCDGIGLRRWAYPLVVVGANSLLAYFMSQLLRGWTLGQLKKVGHLPVFLDSGHWISATLLRLSGKNIFDEKFTPIWQSAAVLAAFWLVLLWLYRQRAFIRV